MRLRFSSSTWLAQLLLLVSTCACGATNRTTVVGAVPDPDACNACLQSRLDNPVIMGAVELRQDDDGKGNGGSEDAERTNAGFRYRFFSTKLSGSGDGRRNRGIGPFFRDDRNDGR
jgi:hypothetical protein